MTCRSSFPRPSGPNFAGCLPQAGSGIGGHRTGGNRGGTVVVTNDSEDGWIGGDALRDRAGALRIVAIVEWNDLHLEPVDAARSVDFVGVSLGSPAHLGSA